MSTNLSEFSHFQTKAAYLLRASTQVNDENTNQARIVVNGLQKCVDNITDATIRPDVDVTTKKTAVALLRTVDKVKTVTIPALQEKYSLGLSAATQAGMGLGALAVIYLTGIFDAASQTIQSAIPSAAPFLNAVNGSLTGAGAFLTNTPLIGQVINATSVLADTARSLNLSSVASGISSAVPSLSTLGWGTAIAVGTFALVRLYDAFNAQPQVNSRRNLSRV